jgi:hypothetical protein
MSVVCKSGILKTNDNNGSTEKMVNRFRLMQATVSIIEKVKKQNDGQPQQQQPQQQQ